MLALIALIACVSRGNYETMQVQLDATRMALSAKNAACYEEIEEREERLAGLEKDLADLRRQHAELLERHEQLSGELNQARERIAALAQLPRPTPPEAAEEDAVAALPPLVDAAVHDIEEALAVRSRAVYEREQRARRHLAVVEALSALAAEGRLEVLREHGRTVVRIPAVQVFNENRVTVSPRGEVLLARLAEALADTEGRDILVAAHTDARPYHSADFDSNWERGFAEARIVLEALADAGVPARMGAASYAGTRPLVEGDGPEAARVNNRIELVFLEDGASVVEPGPFDPPAAGPEGAEAPAE